MENKQHFIDKKQIRKIVVNCVNLLRVDEMKKVHLVIQETRGVNLRKSTIAVSLLQSLRVIDHKRELGER